MARKYVIERRGCGYGCFTSIVFLMVLAALIYVLSFAGAIAAGIGLWFLARFIWRQYVQQRTDSPFVQWGLGFAPITRKLMAEGACAAIALILFFFVLPSSEIRTVLGSGHAQEQQESQSAQGSSTKSASWVLGSDIYGKAPAAWIEG